MRSSQIFLEVRFAGSPEEKPLSLPPSRCITALPIPVISITFATHSLSNYPPVSLHVCLSGG
jgi:hypothetical protein